MGIFDKIFRKRKKRNYVGANTNRLFNDFVTTTLSADSEIKGSIKTLRARARDLSRNNSFAKRFISAYVDNVIGATGVHLQVRSRDPNGVIDTFANNIIEREFKSWGKSGAGNGLNGSYVFWLWPSGAK